MSLCNPVSTRDLFVAWVTTSPIGSPDTMEAATYAYRDVKLRLQYCAGYESKFSLRGREYATTGIPHFDPRRDFAPYIPGTSQCVQRNNAARSHIRRAFRTAAFRKLGQLRRQRGSELGRTPDWIPLKGPNRWHNDGLIESSLIALFLTGVRLLRFTAAWLALIDESCC